MQHHTFIHHQFEWYVRLYDLHMQYIEQKIQFRCLFSCHPPPAPFILIQKQNCRWMNWQFTTLIWSSTAGSTVIILICIIIYNVQFFRSLSFSLSFCLPVMRFPIGRTIYECGFLIWNRLKTCYFWSNALFTQHATHLIRHANGKLNEITYMRLIWHTEKLVWLFVCARAILIDLNDFSATCPIIVSNSHV